MHQLMNKHKELPLMQRAAITLLQFEATPISESGDIPADFFQEAAQSESFQEAISDDRLNIFVGLRMTEYLKPLSISEDPAYRAAILNRKQVRDQIEYVQRLCGKSSRQSENVAVELIADMDRGTDYPPAPLDPPVLPPQVTRKIVEVIEGVTVKKKEASEK